jgi:diadenosine tetraphosphate (Ap4A) HIT family hydrolase
MIKIEPDCPYCKGGSAVTWALPVCELKTGTVYLNKEQSKLGRCTLAYKDHIRELFDLPDEERNEFFADVAILARALSNLFNPDKINYGAYGDMMPHLHFHLVPKYKDQNEWGGTFTMNPNEHFLQDCEYANMICKIKAAIEVEVSIYYISAKES